MSDIFYDYDPHMGEMYPDASKRMYTSEEDPWIKAEKLRELKAENIELKREVSQLKIKLDEYREKAWMYDSLCK